jgi:uncharacterized membrane protein
LSIDLKVLSLLLMTVGLMILAFPSQLLAQGDRVELTLRLLPRYCYIEIIPGENKTLYLEIENSGNKAITNIRLFSDKPKGWIVDFEPESIGHLSAGNHQAIDVNVVADPDTDKGEYTLTLIAEADQTRTVTSTVLHVENAFPLWQWVGLGLGALVIAGFAILYRRFGRE